MRAINPSRSDAVASLFAAAALLAVGAGGQAWAGPPNVGHFSDQNPPPKGASALCVDGKYAMLADNPRRAGTCAHDGGVKTWLALAPPN